MDSAQGHEVGMGLGEISCKGAKECEEAKGEWERHAVA
jgi:hypothetical protein